MAKGHTQVSTEQISFGFIPEEPKVFVFQPSVSKTVLAPEEQKRTGCECNCGVCGPETGHCHKEAWGCYE